jgi:hypothetical protein
LRVAREGGFRELEEGVGVGSVGAALREHRELLVRKAVLLNETLDLGCRGELLAAEFVRRHRKYVNFVSELRTPLAERPIILVGETSLTRNIGQHGDFALEKRGQNESVSIEGGRREVQHRHSSTAREGVGGSGGVVGRQYARECEARTLLQ